MATPAGSLSRGVVGTFVVPYPDSNFYEVKLTSGLTTALAAGDPIFSFRGPAQGAALVYMIRSTAFQPTGFAAAAYIGTEALIARGFTVSDSGGTSATLTGNNQKFRTSDPTATAQDVRVAGTSALVAGTRTLDAQSFASQVIIATTAANTSLSGGVNLFSVASPDHPSPAPLVLASNEGLIVRVEQAYPATGTIQWRFTVLWAEVPSW